MWGDGDGLLLGDLVVVLQAAVVLRVGLDRAARPPRNAALTAFLLVPFGGLLLGPLDAAGALLLWPLLAAYAVTGPAVILLLARGQIAETSARRPGSCSRPPRSPPSRPGPPIPAACWPPCSTALRASPCWA